MAAFFISYGEFLQIAPFRVGFKFYLTIFAFTYRLLNLAKGNVSVCVFIIEKRLLTLFLGFSKSGKFQLESRMKQW